MGQAWTAALLYSEPRERIIVTARDKIETFFGHDYRYKWVGGDGHEYENFHGYKLMETSWVGNEMVDEIGPGIFFQNMIDIMSRLGATDTTLNPGHKLLRVEGNKAVFEKKDGEQVEAEFDHLVLSLGMRPVPGPEWTAELGVPVLVAGDSGSVGRIQEAVTGGYNAARAVK